MILEIQRQRTRATERGGEMEREKKGEKKEKETVFLPLISPQKSWSHFQSIL